MDYHTKKALLNHQIFMEKILSNPEFFLELIKWKDKLRITDKDLGNFYNAKKGTHGKAYGYGAKLINKIGKNKNIDFVEWLDSFCKQYDLGELWKQSLINYVACGYYCPPEKSIQVQVNRDKGLIILEIGADITKEDFNETWKDIKKKIKELPKKEKRNFSKKSFKNLEEILKVNELKAKGIKGIDLITYLVPNDDGDDMESLPKSDDDKKKLKSIKTKRQRIQRKGYKK